MGTIHDTQEHHKLHFKKLLTEHNTAIAINLYGSQIFQCKFKITVTKQCMHLHNKSTSIKLM